MPTIKATKVIRHEGTVGAAAQKLLMRLHATASGTGIRELQPGANFSPAIGAELIAADLAARGPGGRLAITTAGAAWVARQNAALRAEHIDPYTAQHLIITARDIEAPEGRRAVVMDDGESPLAWLARRKGRDGQPMLAPHQLAAGERLRAEFTRAHMMPRVTSNWQAAVSQGSRADNGGSANITETIIAARQRVRQALSAVGPEFSGLLIDVCCFLKGLEDVERERIWPARSAKIVLQLGLDRLARHYGLGNQTSGKAQSGVRAWAAASETANTTEQ